MGDKTGIQWTNGGATWNPVVGCEHVSPGCDNCYAASLASGRLAHTPTYAGLASGGRFNGKVRLLPDRLDQPLRWKRPRMIFVNSMSDLFHKDVPVEYIARVFAVMAATPQHTYQILTKRHARMRSVLRDECTCGSGHAPGVHFRSLMEWAATPHNPDYVPGLKPGVRYNDAWPLPNVWLGVSVENQQWADIRIPALLDTPAAVRFLSCEPLLGPVDLTGSGTRLTYWLTGKPEWAPAEVTRAGLLLEGIEIGPHIDWVIVGGESGHYARPMHPDWARTLRDQCTEAGIAYFFKQWGEHLPVPVFDDPHMSGGRAYRPLEGGKTATVIRERSPGAFRTGTTRPMRPGDRNGLGTMLDIDTMALKVGKHAAGRELDGRTWDEYPQAVA